jgi:cAMP-dependent protein kinase regulator
VIDAMEEEDFSDGDVVIKQGDKGDKFFIVSEGEVVVTQVSESETDSKELARLREGSYFGEIALLTNKERLATITAAGKVRA